MLMLGLHYIGVSVLSKRSQTFSYYKPESQSNALP